jgi:hypothetical protein
MITQDLLLRPNSFFCCFLERWRRHGAKLLINPTTLKKNPTKAGRRGIAFMAKKKRGGGGGVGAGPR